MNTDHWILLGFWSLFTFIHSLFANARVKEFFRSRLQDGFKYYRSFYSLVAASSLILVLVFQFSMPGRYLFFAPALRYLVGLPLVLAGLTVMVACIRKYFFKLSGVYIEDNTTPRLETGGIHRFVRHPLYAGTLLFIWAAFLVFPLLGNLLACSAITFYTLLGLRAEEKKLVTEFGKQYTDYSESTPGLIPALPRTIVNLFAVKP